MTTLTQQLDRIGADILEVLATDSPLTQDQLFQLTKLKNIAPFGWSFALERLEKAHKVEFVSPNRWKLKNFEDQSYIKDLENYTKKKIDPL